MIILKVTKIEPDCFCRPRLKNVDNGRIYADVSLDLIESGYNIPGEWCSTSKDGEPDCPLRKDVVFKIIEDRRG